MKKYILIIKTITNDKLSKSLIGGGASVKAPQDIHKIALQNGYEEYPIILRGYKNKLLFIVVLFLKMIRLAINLPNGATLLIQYPSLNPKMLYFILPFLKKKYLITLLHDINSVREKGELSGFENKVLSNFDEIIVHTPEMQTYFEQRLRPGIKYHYLGCFPYIAVPDKEARQLSKQVCFAGNIDKSVFFSDFVFENKDLDLIVYGSCSSNNAMRNKYEYKGVFKPDIIGHLEGSWGLVWDGDSTETCSGTWGSYLKIIAPHKFSLYVLAGLPLIVWKDSAMAKLVEMKDIGITVTSLSEISARISAVSDNDYKEYCANILKFQPVLLKGENVCL